MDGVGVNLEVLVDFTPELAEVRKTSSTHPHDEVLYKSKESRGQ